MRIICFVIGLLTLFVATLFVIFDAVGLQGVFGVRLGDGSRWASAAEVLAIVAVAWMVGAVAFRPSPAPAQPLAQPQPQPLPQPQPQPIIETYRQP